MKNIPYADIAKRVQEKRVELNLSIEELAQKAEIKSEILNNIENGKRQIKLDEFLKIAFVLDVSPDWLVYGKMSD